MCAGSQYNDEQSIGRGNVNVSIVGPSVLLVVVNMLRIQRYIEHQPLTGAMRLLES